MIKDIEQTSHASSFSVCFMFSCWCYCAKFRCQRSLNLTEAPVDLVVQAGVGCSEGCRCEGCKNMYGRKEGNVFHFYLFPTLQKVSVPHHEDCSLQEYYSICLCLVPQYSIPGMVLWNCLLYQCPALATAFV